MYVEHARGQLDEQPAALEERLTGLCRQLAEFVHGAKDAQAQMRIAFGQLNNLRTGERADAQVIDRPAPAVRAPTGPVGQPVACTL